MAITIRAKNIKCQFTDNGAYKGIDFVIYPNSMKDAENFKNYFIDQPDIMYSHVNINQYTFMVKSKHIRYVIDKLYHEEVFTIQQRSDLESIIRLAEKYDMYAAKLTDSISLAQKNLLTSILEIHVDELLKEELPVALQFIEAVYYLKGALSITDTDESLLLLFDNESLREDYSIILKTYLGRANLESTFIRYGNELLPKIEVQRKIIDQFFYEKIIEKYEIKNNDIKFILHMALVNNEVHKLLLSCPSLSATSVDENGFKRFFRSLSISYGFFERPEKVIFMITNSLSSLGFLFQDLNLKDYMTIEQLEVCSKFVGDNDTCGPRFSRKRKANGIEFEPDPWPAKLIKTEGELDKCGPGYGF